MVGCDHRSAGPALMESLLHGALPLLEIPVEVCLHFSTTYRIGRGSTINQRRLRHRLHRLSEGTCSTAGTGSLGGQPCWVSVCGICSGDCTSVTASSLKLSWLCWWLKAGIPGGIWAGLLWGLSCVLESFFLPPFNGEGRVHVKSNAWRGTQGTCKLTTTFLKDP